MQPDEGLVERRKKMFFIEEGNSRGEASTSFFHTFFVPQVNIYFLKRLFKAGPFFNLTLMFLLFPVACGYEAEYGGG